MKTLAICIISHERPHYLRTSLLALSHLQAYKNRLSVFIFDNSILHQALIRELCSQYDWILLQTPGKSQQHNFMQVSSIPKHRYCMLLHDDDFLYVKNVRGLLMQLENLTGRSICYFSTLYLAPDLKSRVRMYDKVFCPPLAASAVPWNAPSFPSWIYNLDQTFISLFAEINETMPAGKYSDVIFIDRLISYFLGMAEESFSIVKLNHALYIHRIHADQDSSNLDLRSYAKMLWLLNRSSQPKFLIIYAFDLMKRTLGFFIRKLFKFVTFQ